MSKQKMKECPVCGAKTGEERYTVPDGNKMIIVGEGVEITLNKQGDYIARRTENV